jgi:hypothetical protein
MSAHRLFLILVWICAAPAAVQAQPSDSLQVPVGAFRVLGIPIETARPFAMLRAIRVVHGLPRNDPFAESVGDFERLLDQLQLLERGLSRTGDRGLALALTGNPDDRDALRQTLQALGLRLREQQRVYTVDTLAEPAAISVRALFARAGIDCADIRARLNAGETVHIRPARVDVPLPLPFERWLADVIDTRAMPADLYREIFRSREASLLFYGMQAMSSETRTYLAKTPGAVKWLLGRAPAVAAFGGAFRVTADGAVLMPGGVEANDLWESLTGQPFNRPDQFMRVLFGRDDGRLAYFAETLWTLDEPRARFALGLWIQDRRIRRERFAALYQVFAQIEPAWSVADAPFARPSYDAALLLANVHLNDAGVMAPPAYRRLQERVALSIELPAADDRQMRDAAEDGVADAAFLTGPLVGKYTRDRRAIIERVAFGQRVFADAGDADTQDVFVALRAYGRYPAAMLALERLGVRKPALYVVAARRAAALESIESDAAVPLLAQFQGALAVLERLARTRALSSSALEQLVSSLLALTPDAARYRGGISEWLRTQLRPALPPHLRTGSLEEGLLDLFVDRFDAEGSPFSWEGEDFVLDSSRPRRELQMIRERQKANSLDRLLAVYEQVNALAAPSLTIDAVRSAAGALRAAGERLLPARPWPDAPGATPDVARTLDRVVKDLDGIRHDGDVARAARIIRPLVDALDYLLGESLVALAYAGSLGDGGRGSASAVDISHRHAFGNASVSDDRRLLPWRRPARGSTVATGDAVTGAVMGIDLALSRTRLRRLVSEALPESPRLNANDRGTMTDTVALLNRRELDDSRAAGLAQSVQRGRARIEQAGSDVARLDGLAIAARIDSSRRGLLEWTARHAPTSVVEMFSLAEQFKLGGGVASDIHGWGTAHEALTGCLCVRFPDGDSWGLTTGRIATGQTAARVAELNLRVAMLMADLRVPATLFPELMAFATQDYVDSVPLVHPDDWVALTGRAAALTRERVEDYVSAVVASGPVRAVEGATR